MTIRRVPLLLLLLSWEGVRWPFAEPPHGPDNPDCYR